MGGIAGAALGLTALAIPGVGPVIAAGPIAAALGATGVAASAGGLAGLLLGLGVTNDEAKTYATGVYDGGAVLAIHTDDAHEVEADHILRRFNAVRINCTTGMADERSAPDASDASRSHVEAGDPVALANTSDQPHKTDYGPAQYAPENPRYASSFDEFAGVFRRSHSVFFGARGDDYAAYREAYDFGYRAAGDRRAKKSWVEAEPDLRREWEELRGDWAAFRDAVHQGWEAARGSG